MKKNLFVVAAVALMAVVSCNEMDEINNVLPQVGDVPSIVFTAEAEQPAAPAPAVNAAATKTTLVSTGDKTYAVEWVGNESISINGVEFTTTSTGAMAEFSPKASFTEAETYYAVYPYGAATGADLSAVTIPSEQGGSFAEAGISVVASTSQSLKFKNLASIIKFALPSDFAETISTVTITSDKNLAGTGSVAFDGDGNPKFTVTSGSKTITLTGAEAGKTYYVAVLPDTHSLTFRINGYFAKSGSVTTTRSKITNLKEINAPVASSWGIVGTMTGWADKKDIAMYKEGDYEVAKNVDVKSSDEFKFRTGGNWSGSQMSGGIVAPNTVRSAGWVNMTVSEEGVYDIYIDATKSKYYIMSPGKTPSEAGQPGPITITVIYDGDSNRDYLHLWSDGGEVANNMKATSANPFKWTVTIPAGDQQNRDYKVILKKGSGWNSYKTADSEKMCLRNPMPLKIESNKAVHK